MAESNKKLAGFEQLYRAEQDKQRTIVREEAPIDPQAEPDPKLKKETKIRSKEAIKKESNKVRNITNSNSISYEATTFKADRRKVRALKRLALDLDPGKKLQDLFDEALSDILAKYGQEID